MIVSWHDAICEYVERIIHMSESACWLVSVCSYCLRKTHLCMWGAVIAKCLNKSRSVGRRAKNLKARNAFVVYMKVSCLSQLMRFLRHGLWAFYDLSMQKTMTKLSYFMTKMCLSNLAGCLASKFSWMRAHEDQGWQRASWLVPSHNPFMTPRSLIICFVYSLHVGLNRHPRPGGIPIVAWRKSENDWYTSMSVRTTAFIRSILSSILCGGLVQLGILWKSLL